MQAMSTLKRVSTLSNTELMRQLNALVRNSNELSAELLAHLAEMDKRRLFLEQACSSLHAYCVQRLNMSEPAAFKRIAAARLVRRFPYALQLHARGKVHLSGLVLLAPWLNEANATELLDACCGQSKRRIEEILAAHAPADETRKRAWVRVGVSAAWQATSQPLVPQQTRSTLQELEVMTRAPSAITLASTPHDRCAISYCTHKSCCAISFLVTISRR
jgi:hypothetical protein